MMDDKLGRIGTKEVMGYFKVIVQHLPGGTEENHNKLQTGYPYRKDIRNMQNI
jgi:hypothetical protein